MGCHNEYRYMAAVSSVAGTAPDMAHSTWEYMAPGQTLCHSETLLPNFFKIFVIRSKKYLLSEKNQGILVFLMSVSQGQFNYQVT